MASQSTSSLIVVPSSLSHTGGSSFLCWEHQLAFPQASIRSPMAKARERTKTRKPDPPDPNNWCGWNMPTTPSSVRPQACLPSSVPLGISLRCSQHLKRRPPAHQCKPSFCAAGAPEGKLATLFNNPVFDTPGLPTVDALKPQGTKWDKRSGCS